METALRDMQLVFIGKVLSGVSHEFKNHLSTINELNGLLIDLLRAGGQQVPARVGKIAATIEDRIAQASALCSHLSSFSHRLDQPCTSFDVNCLLAEELTLLERFIHQRQAVCNRQFQEGLPAICTNAPLLQFAVFCLIGPSLGQLGKNDELLVTTERHEDAVKIAIRAPTPPPHHEKGQGNVSLADILPYVFAKLAAQFSVCPCEAGWTETTLFVPSITEQRA